MFKEIKNYENYLINEDGVILKNGKELKHELSNKKYLSTCLYKNNIRKHFLVHRLVYETFVSEIKYTIDHIDGNKLNNNVSNLREMSNYNNWKKSYDINIKKNVDGFKQIPDNDNYYIDKLGNVLSFKIDKINGKIIKHQRNREDFIQLWYGNKYEYHNINDLIKKTYNI